ncbi:GTP cyclohydrolase II [Achromobacter sp. UMC71]|uniref:GTP cyclohydrolase II n=1 Tax=Achromobacter sp. UMC71 TaxID=1862320 RepID=UPI00351C6834
MSTTVQIEYKVASTQLKTAYGTFDFQCFSWGPHEEDNVLCLSNLSNSPSPPICRLQSACYTAEIFRSLDCDCHEQLQSSLEHIAKGGGLLIYMLCDGRGAGLFTKTLGLELGRIEGLDTSDAYARLGVPQDPREYSRAAAVLRHLDIPRVRLLTNNPRKIAGLRDHGIEVQREALEICATTDSAEYLRTKAQKMGHLIQQFCEDKS